jgi:hypothetical protein
MKINFRPAIIGMLFFSLLTVGSVLGCKGSDTREEVDDVVEEVTGKKHVVRMQKMKQDIEKIKKKQKNRLNQMDLEKE